MSAETRSAVIMYGKPVAEAIDARVRAGVAEFRARHRGAPSLAIVQVGMNAASERYIRKKIESCERLEMKAELRLLDEKISGEKLREEVERLDCDSKFHGILVQLPLPRHIEEPAAGVNKFDVFDAISPAKDVDGIGREAATDLYRAQQSRMRFLPATALAVRRMMAHYKIETEGKLAVVIGRNDITAKPVVLMLGGRMCNAAALWIHRYVSQAEQAMLIRNADILVTSVGSSHFRITGDMLKPGVVVFDIATRVDEKGKLNGDVDLESALKVASCITPVPRGIGPVTVAALNENLLRAARFSVGEDAFGYRF